MSREAELITATGLTTQQRWLKITFVADKYFNCEQILKPTDCEQMRWYLKHTARFL